MMSLALSKRKLKSGLDNNEINYFIRRLVSSEAPHYHRELRPSYSTIDSDGVRLCPQVSLAFHKLSRWLPKFQHHILRIS